MNTLLVATDGSASAERAVAFAAQLADATHAKLVIFAVSDGRASSELEAFGEAEHATTGDMLESEMSGILARARAQASGFLAHDVQAEHETGDPTALILQRANALHADAIVAGKRGHGRLSGLLLGSVSQKLVTLASCPVVIVP